MTRRLLCLLTAGLLPATTLPAAEVPAVETVIESRACDISSTDTETTSIFTGSVVITATNLRLTCDRLEIVSLRTGDKADVIGRQGAFKSLLATGHVHLVQGDREATCERAEVLPDEDKLVLSGRPMITDHGDGSVATGEPIVLLRGERRVRGTNVKIVMPPLKDLGFDKKLPPAAPTEGTGPTPAAAKKD